MTTQLPQTFAHHRLDAYHVAFEAMLIAVRLSKEIPRGYRSFADQLKRSASSVVAQIAEGANRIGTGEKRQRFSGARGEAGEAAAWAELMVGIELLTVEQVLPFVEREDRVVAMLSRLIAKHRG
jgi:four helix bundle protein